MELTSEIAYLVGFIGGDGNLSERRTALIDKSLEFHENVIRKKFKESFGIVPIISPMKTRKGITTYRSRVNSKEVYLFFSEQLKIPIRRKTFEISTFHCFQTVVTSSGMWDVKNTAVLSVA